MQLDNGMIDKGMTRAEVEKQRESDRMIINCLPLLLDRHEWVREAIAKDYIEHTHTNLVSAIIRMNGGK